MNRAEHQQALRAALTEARAEVDPVRAQAIVDRVKKRIDDEIAAAQQEAVERVVPKPKAKAKPKARKAPAKRNDAGSDEPKPKRAAAKRKAK